MKKIKKEKFIPTMGYLFLLIAGVATPLLQIENTAVTVFLTGILTFWSLCQFWYWRRWSKKLWRE